jgi:hypothetical protein
MKRIHNREGVALSALESGRSKELIFTGTFSKQSLQSRQQTSLCTREGGRGK